MWTQPTTEEQRRYYSKHSPKRKVYGWIQTLLQTAHGFLAFAAWTSIYLWVFKGLPQFLWIAPVLSVSTLFALHILFRTTWDTFWYDRLDDDPQTDSSVFIPIAILALLLIAEFNGASMFLQQQVKPIERVDATPIEDQHATTLSSLTQSYTNDKTEIEGLYKTKLKSATTVIDQKIRRARINGDKTGALEAQRAKIVAPIEAAKTAALENAFNRYNQSKGSEQDRRGKAIATVDTQNETEVNRHTDEMGNVGTYAWILSVCLLSLIAALGYARVRINVKSGILPLRNYTVLDAHGSMIERFATAFGDIINRRSLQLAVWIHRTFSPKKALTSFDGTVVAKPGTYNTPQGFFTPQQEKHGFPQATEEDEVLRQKVAKKIMDEAQKGNVTITKELLESEFQKAKTQNGTYQNSPLGKHEPSTTTAAPAGGPHSPTTAVRETSTFTTDLRQPTFDESVKFWAGRVITQLKGYDNAIQNGDPAQAAVHQHFINKAEQSLNVFKQRIEPYLDQNGIVIGVRYQKESGAWVTYPKTQVEAYQRNYKDRTERRPSQANLNALAMWEYALSLFSNPSSQREEVEAIHL